MTKIVEDIDEKRKLRAKCDKKWIPKQVFCHLTNGAWLRDTACISLKMVEMKLLMIGNTAGKFVIVPSEVENLSTIALSKRTQLEAFYISLLWGSWYTMRWYFKKAGLVLVYLGHVLGSSPWYWKTSVWMRVTLRWRNGTRYSRADLRDIGISFTKL